MGWRGPGGLHQSRPVSQGHVSLQKRGDVFIWRRRENNLFLTQLIRIPSLGISMYLIEFTVIYEESTTAQIPVQHSIKALTPFRVPVLLARQEHFLPREPSTPQPLAPLPQSSPGLGKGDPGFVCFFHSSLLCTQDSSLLTSIRSGGWFKKENKTASSSAVSVLPEMALPMDPKLPAEPIAQGLVWVQFQVSTAHETLCKHPHTLDMP